MPWKEQEKKPLSIEKAVGKEPPIAFQRNYHYYSTHCLIFIHRQLFLKRDRDTWEEADPISN